MNQSSKISQLLLLLIIFYAIPVVSGITVEQKIVSDFQEGKIDYLTSLRYRAYLRIDRTRLPADYQNLPITGAKSGTPLLMEIKRNWQFLGPELQMQLASLYQRPDLPLSLLSPDQRFKIHYALDGPNATTDTFARETAAAFDSAYHYEVAILGYPAPPDDFNVDGPELDIYILNMPASFYAETVLDQSIPSTPRDDYSSWIRIDNDFSGYFTSGLDGMRITSAHEFFHMIHIGIRWPKSISELGYDEVFFYEISGTWMEDVMYDHINDYLAYLPNFFRYPTRPFFYVGVNYHYAQTIWNHFLTRRFGLQTVRDIWIDIMETDVLSAIEQALKKRNSTFANALVEYYAWNTITSSLADTVNYYPEGHLYPRVKSTDSLGVLTMIEKDSSNNLLSAKYYLFEPLVDGFFTASVNFEDPDYGQFASVVHHLNGDIDLSYNKQNTKQLGFLAKSTKVYIIPVNLQMPSSSLTSNFQNFTIRFGLNGSEDVKSHIVNIYPNPFKPDLDGEATIEFILKNVVNEARTFIYTENGGLVHRQDLGPCGQKNKFNWNGKNYRGDRVAAGIYLVQIVADEALEPEKIVILR